GGAPVGHVDPDARGHDPRGAALGVERDEGTAEPAGDLPRQPERARGNREVEVGLAEAGRAREPGVGHRAADEDGRAPGRPGCEAKSLCAGSDLRSYVKAISERSPERNRRRAHEGPNLGGITKGIDVWKPIIAAINGYCLAGGMELAMACDIRIAADHAKFGVVNRRWNVGAESGLTQRLPHIVGLGVALDLLITGRWFDAREAYRINFVSRVVKRARLMDECTKLAERICEYPQSSLRTDKEACIRGLGMTLEDGLRLENTL